MPDLQNDPFALFVKDRAESSVDNVDALSGVYMTKEGVKFRVIATVTIEPLNEEDQQEWADEDCRKPEEEERYEEQNWL